MKAGKIVNIVFSLALLAAAALATVFLYRDYQHYDHLLAQQTTLENRLASLEQESSKRASQLVRLNEDSEYVESIIRDRLKYARPDETVFRFER